MHFIQSTDCTNIKADLRALDEHIFVTKNELNLVKNENGRFESELKAFSDIVPIPQLERSVKAIEKEVEELKSRVAGFKSAKAELVTKEEKIKVIFFKLISDFSNKIYNNTSTDSKRT